MARWSLSRVSGDNVPALRESVNRTIEDHNLILAELEQLEQQLKGQGGYVAEMSGDLRMNGNAITGLPARPKNDSAACSLVFHKSGRFLYTESDTFITDKAILGIAAASPDGLATLAQIKQLLTELIKDLDATAAPPRVADASAIGVLNKHFAREQHTHQGVNLDAVQSITARKHLAGAPVYDLGFGILGVALLIPLDAASHTIAAGNVFDHIRITQASGADNGFTVGAGAVVSGIRVGANASAASDSTAALYGGVFGTNNSGPASVKSVHAAAGALGASSGVLVAVNAQVEPVATTNNLSSAIQASLTSTGAHDRVIVMNIGSSNGDRWRYGIASPGGPVPYGEAVFHAWMATGSSAGADFLRLLNNAGTTLFHVDKSGNTFTQALQGSDTTDSTSGSTGAAIIAGGVGIAKSVFLNGVLHVAAANALLTLTGSAGGGNEWLVQTVDSDKRLRLFDNTNGVEALKIAILTGNVTLAGSLGVGVAPGTGLARLFMGGTAIATTDWALSAGWGASAAVTAVTGNDNRGTVTVTTNAADTPTANPTLTLTFKDGTWTTVPIAVACMRNGSTGPMAIVSCSPVAATLVIRYNGTPTATSALTYLFNYIVVG